MDKTEKAKNKAIRIANTFRYFKNGIDTAIELIMDYFLIIFQSVIWVALFLYQK